MPPGPYSSSDGSVLTYSSRRCSGGASTTSVSTLGPTSGFVLSTLLLQLLLVLLLLFLLLLLLFLLLRVQLLLRLLLLWVIKRHSEALFLVRNSRSTRDLRNHCRGTCYLGIKGYGDSILGPEWPGRCHLGTRCLRFRCWSRILEMFDTLRGMRHMDGRGGHPLWLRGPGYSILTLGARL